MERVFLLFLTVLIWRNSSGLAVWNQKPAYYWQGAGALPHPVQALGPWAQIPQSLPQARASVSASPALRQSSDQSTSGSSWFGSSGQWVPPASPVQTSYPVPQTVQSSGTWAQIPQSLPQARASVSASPALRQSSDQSTSGSSWFGSSGQWVPSASPAQTFNPVPQTFQSSRTWTRGSQSSSQAGSGVSAIQSPHQSASWVSSQGQGVSPSQGQPSTAVHTPLTRPVPASGNVANVYTTAQGTYGLQSSGSPSWGTQSQKPSTVPTQFQPSQNVGQVLQGATSSGSSNWYKAMPPGFNPSRSSGSAPAFLPETNNLYASLSQVAAPSADSMFQSAGLGSAGRSSATGSLSLSQSSRVPASVTSSGVQPSQNLGVFPQGPLSWQSTGSSQSVLQGSAAVGPVVQPDSQRSSPSRVSLSLPGSTSSFNFVPSSNSQASSPYAQGPAAYTPGTTSGAPVLPGFSRSVKG